MILEYVQRFLILSLLIKILIYLVPKKTFSRYIAFFAGVVLVIGMLQPVLKGVGVDEMIDKPEYKEWEAKLSGMLEEAALLESEATEVLKKYEENETMARKESGKNVGQNVIDEIEICIDGQVKIGDAE